MCFVSHISMGENTSNSWEYAIKNIWGQSCSVAVTAPESEWFKGHHPSADTHHWARLQLDLRHYEINVELCWTWKHTVALAIGAGWEMLCAIQTLLSSGLAQISQHTPVLPFTLFRLKPYQESLPFSSYLHALCTVSCDWKVLYHLISSKPRHDFMETL